MWLPLKHHHRLKGVDPDLLTAITAKPLIPIKSTSETCSSVQN